METVRGVYDGKAVRPTEAVRARPNTKVLITFLDDETSPFKPTRLASVAGCLPYAGPAKTLHDRHEAIRQRARERWR